MSQTDAATDQRDRDDESLESLRESHSELEDRLQQLDDQRSLSPEEEFEARVLKKRKLALKDQIIQKKNGT